MDLDMLLPVAAAVAEMRSVDAVLKAIVDGLGAHKSIVLARIWLIGPGDLCAECRMRPECQDQTRCLHLEATVENLLAPRNEEWTRFNAYFVRHPLGVRKLGHVAATQEPCLIHLDEDRSWMIVPNWVDAEQVQSFAAQPLVFRGESLGLLYVFSRVRLDQASLKAMRAFADQAAIAIANARAFEEIQRLQQQLELENAYLREEVKTALAHGEIVGSSAALRNVLEEVARVAPTDATVLILGESGSGKELIARAIHEQSHRRMRALVKVNCASIPRELFESEFFGHSRGAFTGAIRDRVGRFQLADRGTLFLDEVGEIPLELQSKLLRVLQEGQFERVGEDATRKVDVRVIAATNRDLQTEVAAGRFREDLFYRLNVFPIHLPPLRERADDVPALALHFIQQACARLRCPRPRVTARALHALQTYDWPGNIREVQHAMERAVIMSAGGELRVDYALPKRGRAGQGSAMSDLKAAERKRIVEALLRARGKIYGPGGAAELLGIPGTTLASRIKALQISRHTVASPAEYSDS